MHPDALRFVGSAREVLVKLEAPMRLVVEFGSYDVNGSTRTMFNESVWHGIDTRPGPRVDEVANCCDWDGEEEFDLVITTEMLEHCDNPAGAIRSAWRALRPGGHLIATMAAPEREPHDGNGDAWTPECGEHYRGISKGELARWLERWEVMAIKHDPAAGDLRCLARKPDAVRN